VEDLRGLSFGAEEVGTAFCLDTLEHCADPLTACRELHRVLRPGGLCVVSSVMFFPVHGYPQDYWRFTPEGLRLLLAPFDDVWACGIGHPELPMQVIAVAGKGRSLGLGGEPFTTLAEAQRQWDRADGKIRLGILHVPLAEMARTLAAELPRAAAQRTAARLRGRA